MTLRNGFRRARPTLGRPWLRLVTSLLWGVPYATILLWSFDMPWRLVACVWFVQSVAVGLFAVVAVRIATTKMGPDLYRRMKGGALSSIVSSVGIALSLAAGRVDWAAICWAGASTVGILLAPRTWRTLAMAVSYVGFLGAALAHSWEPAMAFVILALAAMTKAPWPNWRTILDKPTRGQWVLQSSATCSVGGG